MPGPLITRRIERFSRSPLSVRKAMAVIILATITTVFLGGFLVYVFDRADFPTFGLALWWALQTVTTVGYGDVTPKSGAGRVVGSFVLVESIAFLSIITATITSSFVERARRERQASGGAIDSEDVRTALNALAAQVERLETSIRELHHVDVEGPGNRDG